jgi:hypothetical protein
VSRRNGHSDPTVGRILAKRQALNPHVETQDGEQQPFQGNIQLHIHNLVLQFPDGAIQIPAADVHVDVPPANVAVVGGDKTVSFARDKMGRIESASVKEQKKH